MTWGEIKNITLQKIDEATGEDAGEYTDMMAAPANEALQLLSTTGKYIVQCYEIRQDGSEAARQRYDLRQLLPDYFSLETVYFDGGGEYGQTMDYQMEGDRVLVLPAKAGLWRVYYNAYPYEITGATAEEQELAIDPEVVVLLPLYIASQIYKHDNVALATIWRNEFEAAREALMGKYQAKIQGKASFVALKRGW